MSQKKKTDYSYRSKKRAVSAIQRNALGEGDEDREREVRICSSWSRFWVLVIFISRSTVVQSSQNQT